MEQSDGGLAEHPRGRGALVRSRDEGQRHSGQRQSVAFEAVVTQHQRVEPCVVFDEQALGAPLVLPNPLGEPFLNQAGLLLCGCGLSRVECPLAFADVVSDLDRALLQSGLDDLVRRQALGAPLAACSQRVAIASDLPDRPARVFDPYRGVGQDLCEELPVSLGVDPCRTQPWLDVVDAERHRKDILQSVYVHREPWPVDRGRTCGDELVPDVARQVIGSSHKRPAGRVVEDHRSKLVAGLEFAEQLAELAVVVEPLAVALFLVWVDRSGDGLAVHGAGPAQVGPVWHRRVALAAAAGLSAAGGAAYQAAAAKATLLCHTGPT